MFRNYKFLKSIFVFVSCSLIHYSSSIFLRINWCCSSPIADQISKLFSSTNSYRHTIPLLLIFRKRSIYSLYLMILNQSDGFCLSRMSSRQISFLLCRAIVISTECLSSIVPTTFSPTTWIMTFDRCSGRHLPNIPVENDTTMAGDNIIKKIFQCLHFILEPF